MQLTVGVRLNSDFLIGIAHFRIVKCNAQWTGFSSSVLGGNFRAVPLTGLVIAV